jgi:hypothetical protein
MKKNIKAIEKKILIILLLNEYCDYLIFEKNKDYSLKLEKQIKKDRNLSSGQFVKKYKPLIKKIDKDKDFDKWCKEKPVINCTECGSANCECLGKSSYSKKYGCTFYWWKCHDCGDKWEVSYKDEK